MDRTVTRRGLAVISAGLVLASPLVLAARALPVDDSALTARGRAIMVDVLANDDAELASPQSLRVQRQPAHGSAQVVGNQVRYVPAAGFTGRDSFTYLVKKGRNVGIATVEVDVGEALVLTGRVTDGPIANASVQASVDGRQFGTQADANGDYSLEVIAVEGGMVTLGAQGGAGQPDVSFLSVLGDFDRVRAEAGEDGELSRDENNQVQVTNLSTAQAYLLQLANGGAPITDDAALQAARETLDTGQLLTMAAAIKLSVDGGYPLPAGTSDTLALISDPEALEAFLAAVDADDPSALGETINLIAADPNVTVPTSAADLLGTYTLAYHLGVAGTVNTGNIQGERLTLEADGDGAFVTAVPNADPSLEWSFDAGTGRVVAIPANPTYLVSYPVIEGIGQVRQHITVTRIELARLFEGDGRDTLAVTKTTTFSYPENPELAPGTQTATATNLGIRDEGGILPFTADELADTTRSMWVSGVPYASSNLSGAELFGFRADGTGLRDGTLAFDWSIDPLGRLVVEYADGTWSAYARAQQDGRKGESLAAEWRAADGTHSAALSISAIADGFEFTAANAQGDWRSGFFVSRVYFDPYNTDFFMVYGPGQVGWHATYSTTEAWATPIGWSSNDGQVDAVYYRDGNNQPVHACQPGVDGCYIWQVRRWKPVAMDGNRAYIIEEFLVDFAGTGNFEIVSQRGNFYDAMPAPPFVAAPKPAPMAKGKASVAR